MDALLHGRIDQVKRLAEKLKDIPVVIKAAQKRGINVDEEAWQIAIGLADVEESTQKLFLELAPRLLEIPPGSEEAADILHRIGEEYRHILYHIMDTRFFRYVVPVVPVDESQND